MTYCCTESAGDSSHGVSSSTSDLCFIIDSNPEVGSILLQMGLFLPLLFDFLLKTFVDNIVKFLTPPILIILGDSMSEGMGGSLLGERSDLSI